MNRLFRWFHHLWQTNKQHNQAVNTHETSQLCLTMYTTTFMWGVYLDDCVNCAWLMLHLFQHLHLVYLTNLQSLYRFANLPYSIDSCPALIFTSIAQSNSCLPIHTLPQNKHTFTIPLFLQHTTDIIKCIHICIHLCIYISIPSDSSTVQYCLSSNASIIFRA